ncbi:hypothetical protein E4T47_07822 [Aureobasidium subglaciale]|nr:hypothetical protein E4T47_07822 [Aureobasidium subglaciale]
MSGDAFLARMALGRSLYEPVPEDAERPSPFIGSNGQQYNARGEPICPTTTCHNEAMIAAKNQVLAAVGVCEKRDEIIDQLDEELLDGTQRVKFTDEEWRIIKEGEDDYGELIRMTAETLRNILTWWVMSLRRRLQVGFVSSNLGFTDILSGEWNSFTTKGTLGAIRFLTVGGLPEVISQLFLTFADWYLGEQVLKISKKVIRLKASTRKRFLLLRCVNYGYKAMNALLHLSVYSLSSFSCLQQLGLISSTSLLPPASWLLPWRPSSPLRWAFMNETTTGGAELRGLLCSPAVMWLTMSLFQHSASSTYGHVPLFEYNCILGPHKPTLPQQPANPETDLLTPFSRFRDKMLQLLSWAPVPVVKELMVEDLTSEVSVRNHTRRTERPQHHTATRYRVTELSTLPSNLLALNLDYLFWAILLLPSETLHLRGLATAFSSSSVARSGIVDGVSVGILPSSSNTRIGRANKIGLCLALEFTLDTAVWGGAYLWAKYIGTTRYHWGRT